MPVFYSPDALRMSLVGTTRAGDELRREDTTGAHALASHLPLQMLLYFNTFFFPCWCCSSVFMLQVKFQYLPAYYQALLVTGLVLLSAVEGVRLYLGHVGNLREQVPELAAFWLLSFLFQLPVLLFSLTDPDTLALPLERAVHGLFLLFLLAQIPASFLALRVMTRKLSVLFHLRQLGKARNLRRAGAVSATYGLPYYSSVLPASPDLSSPGGLGT